MQEKRLYPVYFVGAGPGDPGLLTIKAKRLLEDSHVIIYTGSLIPETIVKGLNAKVYNSAGMTLKEVIDIIVTNHRAGKRVVRLHTGDPSIYSAIGEQIRLLKDEGIPYEVVPGVTAGLAAASRIGCELTIPGVSQTVIISRISGRTPVPPREDLSNLARIGASLILYLSVSYIDKVVERLLNGYEPETPVAVVYKATWPSERIILGTLSDIAQRVKEEGIKKTAVIIVADALRGVTDIKKQASKLYNSFFSHGFRKGISLDKRLLSAFLSKGNEGPIQVIFLGKRGREIATRLKDALDTSHPNIQLISYKGFKNDSKNLWEGSKALIFIASCGIVIRSITSLVKSKLEDPAVIAIDEAKKNVVSLLSGHLGNANELTLKIARALGANPVITTSSDNQGHTPLDIWCRENSLIPSDLKLLKGLMARIRDGERIKTFIDPTLNVVSLPKELEKIPDKAMAQCVISFSAPIKGQNRLFLVPRCLHLGVGCHRDMAPELLFERCMNFLESKGIHPYAIKEVCTIDKKANEAAIIGLSKELMAGLRTFSSKELNEVEGTGGSMLVEKAVGARAVSEPAAILCSKGGKLIVEKEKFPDCTFALSMEDFSILGGKSS